MADAAGHTIATLFLGITAGSMQTTEFLSQTTFVTVFNSDFLDVEGVIK